jgi:hypothetical protein
MVNLPLGLFFLDSSHEFFSRCLIEDSYSFELGCPWLIYIPQSPEVQTAPYGREEFSR